MADPTGLVSAAEVSDSPKKGKVDRKKDILDQARHRMKLAIEAFGDSREDELDDYRFYAGSPDNQWQWPQDVLNTRGATQGQTINARPCLTINKLPQHVRQVTNDQRQNRPAGKVIPVDDKADIEVAEILDGMVRHIEYISDADVAYDTACENQVVYGEGYFRILTDYIDDESFLQDIKIGRIRNSFSVYMDPQIQDPCGSDAQWCLITQDMTKDEFEKEYPDATPISSLTEQGVGDDQISAWINDDVVRVAEYFYFDNEQKDLYLYPDGTSALEGSPQAKTAKELGVEPLKTRKTTVKKVKWCKINGYEILEENDWAGKYIPVIRVVGNEFEIEGQLYISGLIRNAKDPQRMYNYWVSQEAEMLALAPKSPFIGYGGQFEGYEDKWKTANINSWPYLEVNETAVDGQGNPLPLPQRSMPPQASSGVLQAKAGASDDIKTVTGQYDASLGAGGNEKSGKAILAREKQSDTGTYHFVDNLARAVRYGTRQIVDLIPKIYDTKRIARIIGLDGETEHVTIDPNQQSPVTPITDPMTDQVIGKIYNPGVGRYDVCVTTGPSYMTKRQEAMDAMQQLLQGNPQLWGVAGDLFIKNMDWPGAQEMAERFANTIPPNIKGQGDAKDPEMAQAHQAIEQLTQQVQQLSQALEQEKQSVEHQKVQNDHFRADIEAYKAETERMTALQPQIDPQMIQQMVIKTVSELMQNPSLEQEEPQSLEMGEMHMQGMPPMGQPPMGGMPMGLPNNGQPSMPPQGM